MIKNKTAQVGDTITWLVATIVIVVILVVSVFAVSLFFDKNKLLKSQFFKSADTLASKSLFSYVLTKDGAGDVVYQQLKTEENLNDFNGQLADRVFKKFYEEEYFAVWLGITLKRTLAPYVSNDYFKSRPAETRSGDVFGKGPVPHIIENIRLNEEKSIELVLAPKR